MHEQQRQGQGSVQAWDGLPDEVRLHWQQVLANIVIPPLFDEGSISTELREGQEPAEIAAILSHDPLLGAKVMTVANSALAGQAKTVTSLERAVLVLGFNLVQAIILTYQMEYLYEQWPNYPRQHFDFIRRWSAASSLLSYSFARTTRYPDPATLSTATLLARLGALVMGISQPAPDSEYCQMANESSRLKYETQHWGITSPILSGQLARRWELADSLATMLEQSWEPLFKEQRASPSWKCLTLMAVAAVLSSAYLTCTKFKPEAILDRYANEVLKKNLQAQKLLEPVFGHFVPVCA